MNKKFLILFLSCLILQMVLFSACANNSSQSTTVTVTPTERKTDFKDENGLGYSILEDDTLEIVLSSDKDSIEIPEKHKGKTITSIGKSAFKMSEAKKIVIPDTVNSIDDYAFAFSPYLESINIPEGVTSIGANAFAGCVNLKTIKLPQSLERINYYAFDGCGLESINIPENVETIDQYAFAECPALGKAVFNSKDVMLTENIFSRSNKVKIYAPKRSSAISYAKSNGIPYKAN